jgi:hypothetical protein
MSWQLSPIDSLTEVERLRERTRSQLALLWMPLLLFGSLLLATVAVAGAGARIVAAVVWGFGAPAAVVATGWFYHRRWAALGARRRGLPYVLTAVALLTLPPAAAALGAWTGAAQLGYVLPALVVAGGYAVFGWLERSRRVAALAVALAAAAVVFGAVAAAGTATPALLSAVYGASFVVLGLVGRARGR